MEDLMMVYELLAKSVLKISLVLGGMLMVFLTFPITRTSRLFAAGSVGSFVGGILIQVATDQWNLLLLTSCSVALGFGIALLPLLNIIGRLNQRLSEDEAIVDELYGWLKDLVKSKTRKLLPAEKPVDNSVQP